MMRNTLEPIAYWPMTETGGDAWDASGNGYTADLTATGITFNNLTLPDGTRIPLFDGTAQGDFWTTGFRDAFNPDQGSMIAICKVADAEWTDGAFRMVLQVRGANDLICIEKGTPYYTMTAFRIAQGTTKQSYFYSSSKNAVMMLVLTWDTTANEMILYSDGLRSARNEAGVVWTDQSSATYTHIGRGSTVSTDQWIGNIGHVGITDKVLSASEVKALFDELYPTVENIFIVGDSKSVGAVGGWRSILLQTIETAEGVRQVLNPIGYAIGGHDVGEMKATIDSYLSSETATPTNILINLGANDIPEPTPQASFEADYIAIIDALRSKYPGVPVYVASPLLRNDTAQNETNCAIINGYIVNVIAHYASGVAAGASEAGLTLEDGIHYANADMATVAARWATALGY